MSALCSGCGEPLNDRDVGSRGRRPRYHGAVCRQRARRARIASQYGGLLAAVAEVEATASALRAALLAGADPADLVGKLRATTNAVVTVSAAPEVPDESHDASPSAGDVTKSVTSTGASNSRKSGGSRRDNEPFDLDSV
ncbi:hypothetical protein [Amycolatopsis arida]|uniref:hypothetical protein n=1 Tax=Amycolatopsis arida TaxID=587909 RepID=UPI001067105E|nr:hypothetical protein [Amycolatopsis arida]